MTAIALPLTIALAAIAAIHAYWAAGGLWPGRTERELVDTVVGDPRLSRMPPAWLTAFVAALLAGLAAWPLLLAPIAAHLISPSLTMVATLLAAMVFLGRGAAGYVLAVRRMNSAEPFATYDRRFYSPLCIVLGVGFVALALL